MAEAKFDEVEVLTPVMEKRIVLTLTEDEAHYLAALVGAKVTGYGEVRLINSSIFRGLVGLVGEYNLTDTTGSVHIGKNAAVVNY